jgi:hypothetical protein
VHIESIIDIAIFSCLRTFAPMDIAIFSYLRAFAHMDIGHFFMSAMFVHIDIAIFFISALVGCIIVPYLPRSGALPTAPPTTYVALDLANCLTGQPLKITFWL